MSILGQLSYKYFHKPIIAPIEDSGGIPNYFKFLYGKSQMKKASKNLKVPEFDNFNNHTTIVGVAGKSNWYQMIFCLYSFYTNVDFNLNTIIIDDGTIDDALRSEIKRQLPFVTIIEHNEAAVATKDFFTPGNYPAIAGIFDKFVVFKKLFHARALIKGQVLVLDADMLFYKKPTELIEWINGGKTAIYMYDKYSKYGIQAEKVLQGLPIKPNVNTGIIGLNNDTFNFVELERLTALYLKTDTVNYLMEQALYAMYIMNTDAYCLPANDYEILPAKNETISPKAVMHHFPTEHRQFYFVYAWKNVAVN